MKIIFVHLGRENLGIEYLSSVLKNAGHQIELALDPGLFSINDNVLYIRPLEKFFEQKGQVIRKVLASDVDIIAFSVYTSTYRWACEIASKIRDKTSAKIVFGGIHPTLVPGKVIENKFVDFVIVGEGEFAFLELAEALQSGNRDFSIKNVYFKKNGKILRNHLKPPILNIDRLPYPDKELFEKDINYRDDYVILTSRGCIFNCSYCCESFINNLYNGKNFRRRSVNSVIEELKFMKNKYHFREVMFNDSIFFTDKIWLRSLLQKFKEEIKVPFRCFGQVNFLDQEVAEMLKWANCYAIEFGLQTLNENTRNYILKRFESNIQSKKAFKICDSLRLRYDIDHIFGLPQEGEVDYLYGAKFYTQLKYLNRIKCHNLTFFPKLEIVYLAKKYGMLNDQDIENIEQGKIGDFFHFSSVKDSELNSIIKNFRVFYKILPLFPQRLVYFIIKNRLYKKFHLIPSIIVMFLQLLVALKGKDYRYLLYFKYYPLRIKRSIKIFKIFQKMRSKG